MHERRGIPLRITLPLAFLILSVALAALGEAQNLKVRNSGPHFEPPPDVGVARLVDTLINAPAWVPAWMIFTSRKEGSGLGGPILQELDWWYRFFLVLLWFFIGYSLDRLRVPTRTAQPERSTWGSYAVTLFAVLYGLALWYYTPRTHALGYRTWQNYISFTTIPVYAWGTMFIFAGLYPISPARMRTWRTFLGALVTTTGAFECCFVAYVLYSGRHLERLGLLVSPIITIVTFSVSLLAAGIYLLTRTEHGTQG